MCRGDSGATVSGNGVNSRKNDSFVIPIDKNTIKWYFCCANDLKNSEIMVLL